MARVSRKNNAQNTTPKQIAGVDFYRTALYERLSVEDNGKKDADSLENQDMILRNFLAERPYLELADVYVDNGHTGTDFDRPGFTRMLEDVGNGKIDCIVVKDFSRLGRNYVEAGNYIEKLFPFMGVRFISVTDNYDSISVTATDRLNASLKNVINDFYAKDISKKLCSTMKGKRERGEYIGNYAPYGYLKDPENHNHLIIDEEIAPIVIEIFEERSKGTSYTALCRYLNEKGYPSPGRLRFERGIITNNNKKGLELLWNIHVLKDLLANVVYIGNLAQGRSTQCLYKGISFHWTESTEWDVVENTHDAIISIELWQKVQTVNNAALTASKQTHGKYSHIKKRENPYLSILKCADCGRVLKYVRSYSRPRKDGQVKDYYNYKCPLNIELGDSACSKKNIRADELDLAVLEAVKKQMDMYLDIQRSLEYLLSLEKKKVQVESFEARINELKDMITTKKKLLTTLYEDFKDGLFTQQEYLSSKEQYQTDISMMEKELNEHLKHKTKTNKTVNGERKWLRMIKKYYNSESITPELVSALIEEIVLYSDNTIDVKFKYMLEFEELLAECERIREEVA